MIDAVRLTSLAHGGGCGCKLSPAVLRDILSRTPSAGVFPDLLVGSETSDDAAVWRLNADQALVATTDFFAPIVDDPRDFGAISAANALSDVYAMGARPIFALAIVGMPVNVLSHEMIAAILAGGAEMCAAAGVPVAGGHSIDCPEPIYGLVALGLAHPDRLLRNSTAQAGDQLILTKPLGVGVLSAALKQGLLDQEGYRALVATATQLNAIGADLPGIGGVHAVTDVTGFGLLGHALELCGGAGLGAEIFADAAPLIAAAEALARDGVRTGAAARNWQSCREAVDLEPGLSPWLFDLFTDPQTSGGLLIAAQPEAVPAVIALAQSAGFADCAAIGAFAKGPARVTVRVRPH
jgi:selenide,water dikinase